MLVHVDSCLTMQTLQIQTESVTSDTFAFQLRDEAGPSADGTFRCERYPRARYHNARTRRVDGFQHRLLALPFGPWWLFLAALPEALTRHSFGPPIFLPLSSFLLPTLLT